MNTYIIRKKVKAESIAQALKKERTTKPDEVSLSEEEPARGTVEAYGFHVDRSDDSN